MIRFTAALVIVLALGATVPAIAVDAERPVYSVGDTWGLADATYRLARVEKNVYVFTAEGDREIRLTRELGVSLVRHGGEAIELTPPPKVPWPLRVGKWGSQTVFVRLRGETSGAADAWLTWRVEAQEPVTAGGRTLDAFRIRYTVSAERPGMGDGPNAPSLLQGELGRAITFDVRFWYAPDVQRIVRAQSTKPLLTFELAGDSPATAQAPAPAPPVAVAPAPAAPPKPAPAPPVATAPAPSPVSPPPVVAPAKPAPAAAPLVVSLSSPGDQARVDSDTVPLAGLVSSARGVSRVVVTLNGAEVARVDEKAPRPAVSLNTALKLREGANLLVVAATDADGGIRQEMRTVHYAKASPLTISFTYPADGARVSEAETAVAGVVTSSRGVAAVTVTLNGTEVQRQADATAPRSVVVSAPLTLHEGANTIVVTAREPDGAIRQEVHTVTLAPGAAAKATPAPSAPPREAWAVVIGVGRYDNTGIPYLKYSVPDADAVYDVLTSNAGIKKDHVLLLTDRTEKKPTLRNIKFALGNFLARSARKDDTVIVYFAGHGAPEIDQRGLERDGLAKYLIPSDADPDDLFSTALPMDDLQAIFGRIEAERVVMFLDACYSGAAGGRTFTAKRTRAGVVDDLFLERLTRSKGRAIITASGTNEVSVELPELGHGIFTYYLTRGLRGAADLNRDGIVSLQELYEYVEQQVSSKARSIGGKQHPVMKGELEGVLPLTKVQAR